MTTPEPLGLLIVDDEAPARNRMRDLIPAQEDEAFGAA